MLRQEENRDHRGQEISLNLCHVLLYGCLFLVCLCVVSPSSVNTAVMTYWQGHVTSTFKYGEQQPEGNISVWWNIFICSHTHIEVCGHPVLAAPRICRHHLCFFFCWWMRRSKLVYEKRQEKPKQCVTCVCGWQSLVTEFSFVWSFQERSSSTPAWLCWVSSSSMAACRRPKPGV